MKPQPWDRQRDETPPAWHAFTAYRDMGPKRSHAKVAQELGKSKPLIARWSSEHSWIIRVAAWDAEQDRLFQLELQVQRRKSAERNIKVANAAMTVAGASLAKLAQQQVQLSPQDIARLIETGSKLERLALGEPTERVAVSGPGTGAADDEAARALTDEERRARMVMLRREITARLGDEESASYAAGPSP